jgi:hypothetical protein
VVGVIVQAKKTKTPSRAGKDADSGLNENPARARLHQNPEKPYDSMNAQFFTKIKF